MVRAVFVEIVPAGQCQDAGGEIFFKRRLAGSGAIAALPQWVAGAVDVQRCRGFGEKELNALIRVVGIHIRSGATIGTEAIADGIFHAQGDEVQALER